MSDINSEPITLNIALTVYSNSNCILFIVSVTFISEWQYCWRRSDQESMIQQGPRLITCPGYQYYFIDYLEVGTVGRKMNMFKSEVINTKPLYGITFYS